MLETLGFFSTKGTVLLEKNYKKQTLTPELISEIMNTKDLNIIFIKNLCVVFRKINDVYLVMIGDEEPMYLMNVLNIILNFILNTFTDLTENIFHSNFVKIHSIINAYVLNGIIVTVENSNIFSEINYA